MSLLLGRSPSTSYRPSDIPESAAQRVHLAAQKSLGQSMPSHLKQSCYQRRRCSGTSQRSVSLSSCSSKICSSTCCGYTASQLSLAITSRPPSGRPDAGQQAYSLPLEVSAQVYFGMQTAVC